MVIGIDASRANHEQKTGVEWYAYCIIQELKKIIPTTVSVVLYAEKPLKGDLARLPRNWTQKVLRWPPRRLWTHIRLSTEIVLHRPDILFIPAHVFPIIHPKKTVMMVHDVAALRFPKSYKWFERWYSIWSARFAVRYLWRVLVPSEFTKKEIEKLEIGNWKLARNIFVVRHGYNGDYGKQRVVKDSAEILEIYGIKHPYMITIGRIETKKNTVNIIKAFNCVKQKISSEFPVSNFQFLLVGKAGYGYEKICEAIENSPFRNDIRELGWLPTEDAQALLSQAAVFVFSSLYEGFGLPLLEAFAAGTPVVASRGSSLEEVGGDAVVYVNPENVFEIAHAMEQLLTNDQVRNRLIKAGRERVGLFSWETCARETARVLGVTPDR